LKVILGFRTISLDIIDMLFRLWVSILYVRAWVPGQAGKQVT